MCSLYLEYLGALWVNIRCNGIKILMELVQKDILKILIYRFMDTVIIRQVIIMEI